MQASKYAILCVSLALAVTPLVAGETVSNQQFGFRLTVPDGFRADPERVRGDVLHAFQRPPAADQKISTFILVSRLGGVLGREKIDPRTFAAKSPQITIVTEKWKEFDIEVFRVPEQTGELQMVTFNAQVPLKPEAVQVTVIGEAARESEIRSVLRSVLASLDGPTNWLNTEQRISRFGEGITRLLITIAVLVALGVGVAVVIWQVLRNRKAPRELAGPEPTGDTPQE